MIQRCKRKPEYFEAVQFVGSNDKECLEFCPDAFDPEWNHAAICIPHFGGNHICELGNWIVKDQNGFYSVLPDTVFRGVYMLIQ